MPQNPALLTGDLLFQHPLIGGHNLIPYGNEIARFGPGGEAAEACRHNKNGCSQRRCMKTSHLPLPLAGAPAKTIVFRTAIKGQPGSTPMKTAAKMWGGL
jgi:hypothetical protein